MNKERITLNLNGWELYEWQRGLRLAGMRLSEAAAEARGNAQFNQGQLQESANVCWEICEQLTKIEGEVRKN